MSVDTHEGLPKTITIDASISEAETETELVFSNELFDAREVLRTLKDKYFNKGDS